MKKLLLKLAKKFIIKRLIDKLTNEKSEMVKMINKKVDIPKLTEKQEEKLFSAVLFYVVEALRRL